MLLHSTEWIKGATDPRALCQTILDKSVDNPDKYQIGLTKIFLRAGMLAGLETKRLDRLNALATIIQKNFLRAMEVKKFHRLRESTVRIQAWWRGVMGRKLFEAIRKNILAIRLQTIIRRHMQRTRFLVIHDIITRFQSGKLFLNSNIRVSDSKVSITDEERTRSPPCRAYSERSSPLTITVPEHVSHSLFLFLRHAHLHDQTCSTPMQNGVQTNRLYASRISSRTS